MPDMVKNNRHVFYFFVYLPEIYKKSNKPYKGDTGNHAAVADLKRISMDKHVR